MIRLIPMRSVRRVIIAVVVVVAAASPATAASSGDSERSWRAAVQEAFAGLWQAIVDLDYPDAAPAVADVASDHAQRRSPVTGGALAQLDTGGAGALEKHDATSADADDDAGEEVAAKAKTTTSSADVVQPTPAPPVVDDGYASPVYPSIEP